MTEIEVLFETYKRAVYQKDVEAFTSIFDEDVQVFDMWQWDYNGLSSWRKMAEGWFASLGKDNVAVSFDDIQIQATNEMAGASAYVRFAAVSETGEELRSLQNRLTWIVRKKDGVWKVIHEHTSGPVDHHTMQVILKR